ncbi:MarR family winged helix-turn-helix transcriptional regulator [Peribacillus sp. NPDC097264]|uniref:MarR family winged helix-turn-helix transcriptional regulator n=1 Tax=unclassified Peribacillus TaxID=2675266 RepID=UPI0038200472
MKNKQNQLFHQHLQLSRTIVKNMNEQITSLNIYHNQWTILNYLKNCGYSTINDISNYLDVDSVIITRSVNSMEENHMIKQVPGKDEEEKRIELTPRGKEVHMKCMKIADKIEGKALDGISEEEQDLFFQTLLKILNNIRD